MWCSLFLFSPPSTMKAEAALPFAPETRKKKKKKSNEKLIAHVNSTNSFITRLLTVNIMRKRPSYLFLSFHLLMKYKTCGYTKSNPEERANLCHTPNSAAHRTVGSRVNARSDRFYHDTANRIVICQVRRLCMVGISHLVPRCDGALEVKPEAGCVRSFVFLCRSFTHVI